MCGRTYYKPKKQCLNCPLLTETKITTIKTRYMYVCGGTAGQTTALGIIKATSKEDFTDETSCMTQKIRQKNIERWS